MAAGTQNFPKILKSLREPSNAKEKCEALTYIRSNSKKLESTNAIKEEQFKELCKLVIDALSNDDDAIQHEAYETLNVMIRDFRNHDMKLFDAMLHANRKTRLKILKILEVCNDNAILALTFDSVAANFFRDCMQPVQTKNMEWLSANACTDSLQPLLDAENAQLSPDQKLEEEIISHAMHFLRRLYKIAAITSEPKVERFDTLVMKKVTLLAYMGHKRQRGPALKLLQQALSTDIGKNIRSAAPDLWEKYKSTLQTVYCKRMLLLVGACELDWATQWNISIQILGTDLHRGAGLINNLLSVEEKAFKSIDTIIRRHAFLSWKLLVDNFALDPQELATARRIKLLCIPLNAKNSKTELIALTKLEVWWHVIIKLYKDITAFVNPMITQFLNFCFGPLGDTPLLSSKYEVVASPGKRFYKTKVVAVDALCQLLVPKQVSQNGFSSILEERLPHSMTDAVFQACYKSVIHSVGEVLLILSQLTDAEMKSRCQIGKILWSSLVHYVQESKSTTKDLMCKNIILVITELINYAGDKSMIKDLFLDTILFDISEFCKGLHLEDDILSGLLMQVLQIPILEGAKKEHYNALKGILQYSVKSTSESSYRSNVLEFFNKLLESLISSVTASSTNSEVALEIWKMLADTLRKYMYDSQEINEGDSVKHSFETVELTLRFPFDHMVVQDLSQIREVSKIWKDVYRQFELQADTVVTVMPNEILLKTAQELRNCLIQNKDHCSLVIHCTEVLLSSINYTALLELETLPAILELIIDLVPLSLTTTMNEDSEIILKALSAFLITVYGHDAGKVSSYLIASEPAVTAALSSESKALLKEIANMWETIVSIFKGLGEALSYSLLAHYKDAIIHALNHTNPDIESQAVSILDLQGSLKNNSNALLETLSKKAKKEKIGNKSETTKKSKEQAVKSTKPVKMVGSFLGRNTASPTTPAVNQEKEEKKIFIEPDSQDYVLINTEVKIDIDRLTEHQIESLKRRRDDIPALYNDLSQSSSQDTQNLQEWFDKKNKHITEADKPSVNKNDKTYVISDHDANKENKISATLSDVTDKPSTVDTSQVKSVANVAENSTTESGCNSKADTSILEKEQKTIETQEVKISEPKTNTDTLEKVSLNNCTVSTLVEESSKNSEATVSSNSVVKKLNFESLEEYPESIANDSRLSPSILDCGRRRLRRSGQSKSETSDESVDVTTSTVELSQRTLRFKATAVSKTDGSKQTLPEEPNGKKKSPEDGKRGVKRKVSENNDSSLSNIRRRRKLNTPPEAMNNDNTSEVSRETDPSTMPTSEGKKTEKQDRLSQRTRKEMSRLRINMVFDSPLPERRRSKVNEEALKESGTKKSGSGEQKSSRSRGKGGEKDRLTPTSPQRAGKRRSKRSLHKTEADRNEESAEGSGEDKKDSNNKDSEACTKSENAEVASEETLLETDHNAKLSKIISNRASSRTPSESEIAMSDNNTVAKESIRKDLSDSGEKKLSGTTEVSSSEQESESQDAGEDVIESSQDTQELLKIGRKYKDKQCFIKINKIEPGNVVTWELLSPVEQNATTGNNLIENRAIENNTASATSPKSSNEDSNGKFEETTNVANTDVDDNQQDEEKRMTNDMSKTNDTLQAVKNTLFGFVSPKGSIKRLAKFKSYSHGRAAHMLGLVTKQSRMENDTQPVTLDDDAISMKKSKPKDTETETKKDRSSTSKETDKITTPCSSRQEKMFNNMKSTEFSPSTSSLKLFSNLKNDGEKISPKLEKSINALDCANGSEGSLEKKRADNTSPTERDQLPILEWSSANPPSLTASPSASILKRNRQTVPEPDPECTTPNKRKRVSFADPPVSKEMGYQIVGNSSPQRINRLGTPRVLIVRRDSPLRLRQTRSKLIQIDPENSSLIEAETSAETNADLPCDKENELLSQIDEEEIECTADLSSDGTIIENIETPSTVDKDESMNDDHPGMNPCKKLTMDTLNLELEITDITVANSNVTTLYTEANQQNGHSTEEKVVIGNLLPNESSKVETQQDLFIENQQTDNTFFEMANEEKQEDNKESLPIVNTTLDSLKFGNISDSVIEGLPKKLPSTNSLDDTVDANNLTGIDSSANSDEIFCGKLVRTSTQATENADEQDTLPVTDSVFGSLPLSQESQSSGQYSMEVPRPELLDSTQPIYPNLISCTEPLTTIVRHLTNPLWVQYLATNLSNRGLRTVGDLARLTEREVNRIPVKGNPKVEFVKNVLRRFESSNLEQTSTDMSEEKKDQDSENVKLSIDNATACSMTTGVTSQEMETTPQTMSKDTLSHSTPLPMTSGNKTRNIDFDSKENLLNSQNGSLPSTLDIDSNCEKSFEDFAKPVVDELNERSVANVGTSGETPAGAQCTTNGPRTPVIMKSVGTCTDFMDPVVLQSKKRTKSVEAQMALEDLLDEIDVNLVLESAARRCAPERLLYHYKNKMRHIADTELERETIKLLGLEPKQNYKDITLKAACRACGINKVLLRLPDIFGGEKQFFSKVLTTYCKKIKPSDCINVFDFAEVKDAVCQKCTTSELADMLSKKLDEEEREGINKPIKELPSLNTILKRMPKDVIISHTVANDELIPSRVVLDIGLENNSPDKIAQALKQKPHTFTRKIFDGLWSPKAAVDHITNNTQSRDSLLDIFRVVSSQLSTEDLLNAYHEAMKQKLSADTHMDALSF